MFLLKKKKKTDMEWILCKDKMPEEKSYHVDGSNYWDKKDRDWTESESVLVVYDDERYGIAGTRNGKFREVRDCDNFPHRVIAWMPIPKFDFGTIFDSM